MRVLDRSVLFAPFDFFDLTAGSGSGVPISELAFQQLLKTFYATRQL